MTRWALVALTFAACHSPGSPDAGSGADAAVAGPTGFERVDDALAMGTSKVASPGDLEGRFDAALAAYFKRTRLMSPDQVTAFIASNDPVMAEYREAGQLLGGEHGHPGAFLSRLGRLFGRATGPSYTLRHRATGLIVTAYSGPSGPAYGASNNAPAAAYRPVLRALDAMVWAAQPLDCRFVLEGDDGPYETGARGGQPFLEALGEKPLFDFYEAQIAAAGDDPLASASTATLLLIHWPGRDATLEPRALKVLTAAVAALEKLGPDEAEDRREHAETLEGLLPKLKLTDPRLRARLAKLKK